MRSRRSLPPLAYWAGGILLIAAAALVLTVSRLGAIVLVVGGFALLGLYWVREHPRGHAHRMGWTHGAWLPWGDGDGGGGDGGGGDGGGGGS
jgi:hypothetical protein